MPALNFQARFAPLVESGEKRQTIRAMRKDGRDPKPGDTLYLYTGMRTKACRKIGEAIVRDLATVWIDSDGGVTVFWFARKCIVTYEPGWVTRFARADGFNHIGDMRQWFEKTHGLPFEGLLIRW